MDGQETGRPTGTGAGVASGRRSRALVADVYGAVADRVSERLEDVARFVESTVSFQPWLVWEMLSAVATRPGSGSGFTARPRPAYADLGVPGSRDVADLLVVDVATARRVLTEITVISDWASNKWIDNLDGATRRLSRTLVPDIVPLQVVVTASHTSPIDVNHRWQQWLGMSRVWKRETALRRTLPLGAVGQVIVTAWDLSGAA